MPKYTYAIAFLSSTSNGRWVSIPKPSLGYCQGYLDAYKGNAPRLAVRIERSDGKVIDEIPARDDVNIGMVAGFPSPEQYEMAGNEALAKAESIRSRNTSRIF